MKHLIFLSLLLIISCKEKQGEKKPVTGSSENIWAQSKPVLVLMDADIDPFVSVQNMSVDEVKVLLSQMHQADQQYRDSLYNGNPGRKDYYEKKIAGNDQANKRLLDKIIQKYGWPGIAQFGKRGSDAAWYVAWHQRSSEHSMAYYLKFMEEANRKQDMHQEHFMLVKNQLALLRSVGNAKK